MVHKLSTTLLLLAFATVSFSQIRLCDNGLTKTVSLFTDGEIKSIGFYKNGIKTGKWTYYYRNGIKESTRYYDALGKPNGTWTYWYENGKKWNTVAFNEGAVDGKWTYWYKNGKKWHQLSYEEGEVGGKWTFWHEDGSVNDAGKYLADTAAKG